MLFGGICFITDRRITPMSVEDSVTIVLDAGVRCIQYREKDISRKELYYQAERLKKITQDYDATYIVNDHSDIALAVDADGVHLGQDDLPLHLAKRLMKNKMIGISTHTLEEALRAEEGGADYIGFGPLFHTITKDAGEPKGLQGLREISSNINIPIVAIGGIDLAHVSDVFRNGAHAVAVASAILKAGDIQALAKRFVQTIRNIDFLL